MEKVIFISLSGHPVKFRSTEAAYNVLSQYLERARLRLKDDPDHDEVLRDLEQSIAEKLGLRMRSEDHVLDVGDVNGVLAEVGPVDPGNGGAGSVHELPAGRRRLVRIQEGQDIFGVCTGLAAYSGIDVDWVRTIFILLTLVTGGVVGIIYIAMGFILPLVPTREAYAALHNPDVKAS